MLNASTRNKALIGCAAALILALGLFVTASEAWTAGRQGAPDKLVQARIAAAARAHALCAAQYKAGAVPADTVYLWSARWREAQGDKKASTEHLKRMQTLAAEVKTRHAAGAAAAAVLAAAQYYVAEAEVWAAGGR